MEAVAAQGFVPYTEGKTKPKWEKWSVNEDAIIMAVVEKAEAEGISRESAFLAVTEQIPDRTPRAVASRYYVLKTNGKTENAESYKKIEAETDEQALDIVGMFSEMKKIIKERDELRAKVDEYAVYKMQHDELKKKMQKIEKDAAAFADLLRGKR